MKLGDSEPAAAGCVCGAAVGERDEDGFCLRCGRREHRTAEDARVSQPDDHIELALSPLFAAVSDRGRRHAKNEDRFGIFEANGAQAMVVCDGVSTSRTAEVASAAVAEGVLESLAGVLSGGSLLDPASAVRAAIGAGAARLIAQASPERDENPPSTTVVVALVWDGVATVGWLGDSRAYWIDLSGEALALPLTEDHSWLNAVVGAGELTAEQAARSPQAHAITRWVGADSGDTLEPETIAIVRHPLPEASGLLLLCTDGLWNYFPTPEGMAGIVREASRDDADALAIARQLVDLANGRGGHDNITAAVLRHHAPEPEESGETASED
jgi:serine/threonine protein phosphatase PrpC